MSVNGRNRHRSAAQTPDVLVLGGGGIAGEAWMSGLLTGLDEAVGFDSLSARGFVGTSAGAIIAAHLVAGIAPRTRAVELDELGELEEEGEDTGSGSPGWPFGSALTARSALASTAIAPAAAVALGATAPAGAILRRGALNRIAPGRRPLTQLRRVVERLGLEWDGRLKIAAVDQESGRRVVFGSDGAPRATVAEAVQASCAIPGVFRPVRINGRRYVDGGAWSPTNLDTAAVARAETVLCINPTASLRPTLGEPAGAIGPISRAIARTESLVLKRRGVRVTVVNPDRDSAAAMGFDLMNARRQTAALRAGLAQGRRLARDGPSGASRA
jgi:NTE family protein